MFAYTLIHNEVFRATGQIPIPNALKKGCYCPAYFPVVLNFSENIASAGTFRSLDGRANPCATDACGVYFTFPHVNESTRGLNNHTSPQPSVHSSVNTLYSLGMNPG